VRREGTCPRTTATDEEDEMLLPQARGPLSDLVIRTLASGRELDVPTAGTELERVVSTAVLLSDEDLHLTLWTAYELYYRGFDDVDPDREWDPDLIGLRRRIERLFEAELRAVTSDAVAAAKAADGDFPTRLLDLVESSEAPSLAAFLQRSASTEQVLDFMMQRSLYHLRESDPHSFVLPRVDGPAKVALAELQYDEYGAGRPDRLHATMFADALEGCGLERTYGAYVNQASGHTFAVNNVMSLFALQRRLRGAALGHQAAFEATSSVPCRKIAAGVERVGLPPVVSAYFDEHVEADAAHEQVAVRDICGSLVAAEPELADDVLFGAAACLHLDALAAQAHLEEWTSEQSSRVGTGVAS
jgi:hypothetical protein